MPAPTKAQRAQRKKIAKEFAGFRARFCFTQVNLAEALGVSRRTIQYAENGKGQKADWLCMPHPQMLKNFEALRKKHEAEQSKEMS